jgi:hypothetical protein
MLEICQKKSLNDFIKQVKIWVICGKQGRSAQCQCSCLAFVFEYGPFRVKQLDHRTLIRKDIVNTKR